MSGPPSPRAPSERRIQAMFDGLARRYDLLNRLLSLGLDRGWRRAAAGALGLRGGEHVLDLGCGTGEVALEVSTSAPARIVGVDLSELMLAVARRRLGGRAVLVRASAIHLPFRDGAFDAAVSGFVLRNLHDLPAAFSELARVVTPGGRIALLDITEPSNPAVRWGFDVYLGTMAPAVGALVGKRDEYRYLVRSLAQIPPPAELCGLLNVAGFVGVVARPLTLGVVTLFTGTRASALSVGRGRPKAKGEP